MSESLYVSICVSLYLSLSLSLWCPSRYLCLDFLSMYLCMYLRIHLSICPSLWSSVCFKPFDNNCGCHSFLSCRGCSFVGSAPQQLALCTAVWRSQEGYSRGIRTKLLHGRDGQSLLVVEQFVSLYCLKVPRLVLRHRRVWGVFDSQQGVVHVAELPTEPVYGERHVPALVEQLMPRDGAQAVFGPKRAVSQ